ncbi:MAG TPA: hypothetical protein DEB40_11015 [Elusimicrobia bacterium]|nr:hypothetical protein [Elusimicrobiota bacterium]HBT62261.1 hypothetical protein [Elusimicrobiota bacterium]
MPQPVSRRTWTWACAALLAALSGLVFWRPAGLPALRPEAGERAAQEPASLEPRGKNTPASLRDAPCENGERPPSRHDASLRDAPGPKPELRPGPRGAWFDAPWRCFWTLERGASLEVPAPRRPVSSFRRGQDGRIVTALSRQAAPRAVPAGAPGQRLKNWAGRWLAARDIARRALRQWRTPALQARRVLARRAARLFTRAEQPDAASRRPRGHAGTGGPRAWARAPGTARQSRRERKPPAAPRFRPVLLSQLLGKNAIRPPKARVPVPDLSGLRERVPGQGPDHEPLKWFPAPAEAVEAARLPGAGELSCRASGGHWHSPGLFHHREAWGLWDEQGWLWLARSGQRWWAWTDKDQPCWLWFNGHWWWSSRDVWFLLHQGQAWGYRLFGERQSEGLIHPATGTEMVYSEDGRRVAVITPGDGAWLFDARTGAVLGRWTEDQMPRKPKPRAPGGVTLP